MARVLVVDDEEGIRSFLSEALQMDDHEVLQAADGQEALQILGKRSFHVLITDLKMPRLDGMQLLRKLRTEQPELQVIMLTAHGSIDSAVEAMKLGAFDYLQKPISSLRELRVMVRRAVERRQLQDRVEQNRQDTDGPLTWGAPAMKPVEHALRRVAATESTVLLMGESGTGKEVAAQAVHRWSKRSEGPFVAVNCAALSENLLESELFGHEKGAFTGATKQRRGRLELCDGGTFFLDEVAELRPELQAKLLRVLQEKSFERVGGNRTINTDVRWIAATNRDLHDMMAAGRFREDLFHRLSVFPVRLPPLRERFEDLGPLSRLLLRRVAADVGRSNLELDPSTIEALVAHSWPGNIRELSNVLERAAILATTDTIMPEDLMLFDAGPSKTNGAPAPLQNMEEAEKQVIQRALQHYEGNRKKAAEHLGIGLRTLYDKIKKYDMS